MASYDTDVTIQDALQFSTMSSTTTTNTTTTTTTTTNELLSPEKIQCMLQACASGDESTIAQLVNNEHYLYARQQEETEGMSPLMVAAREGHGTVVRFLLERGAPWNALDRYGKCAGDYATERQHWDIVNELVDHATRAELILGAMMRANNRGERSSSPPPSSGGAETSTKPNYLRQRLTFSENSILDEERDAVMMKWERPLMEAHAQILTNNAPSGKRVLNIGFGMGIIDTILQEKHSPSLHVIVEAHPDIYAKMKQDGWHLKPNVRVCFGKWQDVIPKLIEQEGLQFDGIFFDTYGEHFLDLEDFHKLVPKLLSPPNGVYSFFNGLAPDNLFFHGVACQCVQVQLGELGLETEFLPCEIQMPSTQEWEGIRRKYWHNDRDTYYLPRATWKPQCVDRKTLATSDTPEQTESKRLRMI